MRRARPPLAVLAAALWATMTAVVAAGGRPVAVQFAEGKLSVDFDDVPLSDAFQAIEAKAGVSFRMPPSARSRRVSASFQELPLERGVREVLRRASLESHAVIYDPAGGAPKTFVVMEPAGPGGSSPPPLAAEPPAEERDEAPPPPLAMPVPDDDDE